MGSHKLRSIRTWHIRNARALDVARWYFHFEDGEAREVLKALACYQNPDGGFGHGLEPDIRTAGSSPIATWAATQILREIGLPDLAREMIHKILDYLEAARGESGRWPATVAAMNEAPHAPWWHFSRENEYWGWNPSVELAAFILETAPPEHSLVPVAETLVRQAMAELMAPAYEPNPHELANFARAGEIIQKVRPELLPEGFVPRLSGFIASVITPPDSYRENEYLTTPTFFLDSPQSPWYPAIRETADFFTGHLEDTVTPAGFWNISWTWGDQPLDPDSLRDWRGSLIMENMLYLQHFKPDLP